MERGRDGWRIFRRGGGSRRWLYSFFDGRPGAGNGGQMVRRPGRSHSGRRRHRRAGIGAALGAFARRSAVSPSLRVAVARCCGVDATAAARGGRAPRLWKSERMIGVLGALARPLLARLPPERAHRAAIAALKLAPAARQRGSDPRLGVHAFGLDFPNPLGMAAGVDKNAEVPRGLLALGFGFVEVGTLTPRPQPGNPRPRLFRLTADRALVNRLGFNNLGYEAARGRLAAAGLAGVVGVNVG